MYARRYRDQVLTFDFAEGLIKDNLLFVDRETKSIWSQLEAKAVSGELEGEPLQMYPALQTTWKFWRERYPDTRVMVLEGEGRPYLYRDRKPGTPRPAERPTEHDTRRLGMGLAIGDDAVFFAFHELAKAELPLTIEVGGTPIRVFYEHDALTAWAEDEGGEMLSTVLVYDFGWESFFPDSRFWKTEG